MRSTKALFRPVLILPFPVVALAVTIGCFALSGPAGAAADPPAVSAGTPLFGTVRCTRRVGLPLRVCRFRAVRRDDNTVLVVSLPGGGTRAIFLAPDGRVVGTGRRTTDLPTRANLLVRRRGDTMLLSVGDERFEIRDSSLRGR